MRRRSGGIHCQTYEELLDTLNTSKVENFNMDGTGLDDYSNIEMYLLQQQTPEKIAVSQHQYFFTQRDQLNAQEDQELSHPSLIESVEIGLLCSAKETICEELVNDFKVLAYFKQLYRGESKVGQFIQTHVENNIVRISLSQCCFEEDGRKTKKRRNEEVQAVELRKKCQQLKHQPRRWSQGPVELVVYYNTLQAYLSKDQPEVNKNTLQIKFWVIQQQQEYSDLVQVYLKKCKKIYQTSLNKDQLFLTEISIRNKPMAEKENSSFQFFKLFAQKDDKQY